MIANQPQRHSLATLPVGVATASMGMSPCHTLESKFAALCDAGFKNVEIGYHNYVSWVKERNPGLTPAKSVYPPDWAENSEPDAADNVTWQALYDSAEDCKTLAAKYGLTMTMLQPFQQCDAWEAGSVREAWARSRVERWLPLTSKLGIEILQVGTADKVEAKGDDAKIASDLRWMAELAARQSPPVKLAYEALCFSPYVNDWERTWKIVQQVNHPNFGLCMDVSHWPLAPAYGFNVHTGDGWRDADVQACLERVRAVPKDKIFYVEISDLIAPDAAKPLGKGSMFDAWTVENKPPQGDVFAWMICSRSVPLVGRDAGLVGPKGDLGARVVDCLRALLDTGYDGHVVFEQFEAIRMAEDDSAIPTQYALACAESWKLLSKEL